MFNKKRFKLLILIVVLAGPLYFWHFYSNLPQEKTQNKEDCEITVEKGTNFWEVSDILEKKGLIKNKYHLAFYLWTKGLNHKIVAQKNIVPPEITMVELGRLLTHSLTGSIQEIKVTFPEGWTARQMAERLREKGLPGEEFLKLTGQPELFYQQLHYKWLETAVQNKTLEGFLFPDTYFFANPTGAQAIIEKMLNNFNLKVYRSLELENQKTEKEIYQAVIMASIIEREVKSLDDKKKVSDIFWKRLRDQYPLQSCATLAYVLGENKKQFSYEDTQTDSPYNTYKNVGLPPTPIDNPGKDSLIAAFYPEKTDYYFFLSNPQTGQTVFSQTLEEHNRSKLKNGL